MDPRYNHEKLNETISDCFNDIINEFNFNVKTNPKNSGVELSNNKCIIKFGYDSGFVSGSFVDPIEKAEREKIVRKDGFPVGYPNYPVFSVWKFLYPNDKTHFNSSGNDLVSQTLACKQLIYEKLKNVLNGDFSWTAAYKKNDKRLSKKIEYMTNHWASDNPIRLKFNEGNPEWEKAFDEYKNYLDKLQQY